MLTKNRVKLIRALDSRKGRRRENLFVAEGAKLVGELMAAFEPVYLAATAQGLHHLGITEAQLQQRWGSEADIITHDELERISLLQTPQDVLALFRIPTYTQTLTACAQTALCIMLDGVQDPGNLGTIVRLADWFGVTDIFCSATTADVFNPKAVQATMGALARVRVHYINILEALSQLSPSVPVFGTALNGSVIWDEPLAPTGVVVMGNEGNGVSAPVQELFTHRLFIPRFPADRQSTESLNVAMATGIVLSEFRRRQYAG